MRRTKVFLTLNLPERGLASGIPVVASQDSSLLRLFKRLVLKEWSARVGEASDDLLVEVNRLELEKLKATLDLLIPDTGDGSAEAQD